MKRKRQVITWLLGIQITHYHKMWMISLSQATYIKQIIAHFSLADAKLYSTPMVLSASYLKANSPASVTNAAQMRKVPYYDISKNQHFLFHLIPSYYILFLLFWG